MINVALDRQQRAEIECQIEHLIELLDSMDGDENLEPSLAGFDDRHMDDREEENEHGGDIQDEPHDDDFDLEHSLGWSNPMGLRVHVPDEAHQLMVGIDGYEEGSLSFVGDGYRIGRKLLRLEKKGGASVQP
jgi:hypothetical protein